jgi:hypothetical protein
MNCVLEDDRTAQRKSGHEEAAAIGDILWNLPITPGGKLDVIQELNTPEARATHAARVMKMMDQFAPAGSAARGKERRRRILDVLEQFSQKPPVTIDVPRSVWRDLHAAAAYVAAKDEQWDSSCGPLIAASNVHLHGRIGWSKARTHISRMAQYGFTIPYRLAGNGKRYFALSKGKDAPHASGWSLAPLLLLEEHLIDLARRERTIADHHMTLPRQISAATSTAYRLIRTFDKRVEWACAARWKLDILTNEQRKHSRRKTSAETISRLKKIASLAEQLLERITHRLTNETEPSVTEKKGTRVPETRHHHYSSDSVSGIVGDSAEGRSGDIGTSSPASSTDERSEFSRRREEPSPSASDPHGIERSGFEWSEAPALFPCIKDMIELGGNPGLNELHKVAQACQINQRTAAYASGMLGPKVALLCVLIAAQRLSEGSIQKTTEAYMQGLIKKARSGDLNIGHTLFGRREAAYGRTETKRVRKVRSPGEESS